MLEFPGLVLVSDGSAQYGICSRFTPGPYGDCPESSLLCRTLWKSYLFSWRTKLAKLLCLKCFGRMDLVNLSFCRDDELAQFVGRAQSASHLEHHEAVSFISPSDDLGV